MSKNIPWILGLSTGQHNGAACLLHGDELIVAMQEERLTRIKRDSLPRDKRSLAVAYCLEAAGIRPSQLSIVVESDIAIDKANTADNLSAMLDCERLPPCARIPHHLGHAASVFYTSGF